MGDASGIGPEVLLSGRRGDELRHDVVVYGDMAAIEHYNRLLGYGVQWRGDRRAARVRAGFAE